MLRNCLLYKVSDSCQFLIDSRLKFWKSRLCATFHTKQRHSSQNHMAPSICSNNSISSFLTFAQCPSFHSLHARKKMDRYQSDLCNWDVFSFCFSCYVHPFLPAQTVYLLRQRSPWGSQFKQGQNVTNFEMILVFFAPFFFFWEGLFFFTLISFSWQGISDCLYSLALTG